MTKPQPPLVKVSMHICPELFFVCRANKQQSANWHQCQPRAREVAVNPAFFSWCVCYGDTNIFTSMSLKMKTSHSYQPVTLKLQWKWLCNPFDWLIWDGGVCHLAACLWSHFWSYSVFAVFRVTHRPGEPMNTSWPPGVPACCCMCLINAHRENMRRYLLTVAHFNSRSMMWRHDSSKLLLPSEHRKGKRTVFIWTNETALTCWAQSDAQCLYFTVCLSVLCFVFLMYKCLLLHLTNTSNILGPIKFYFKVVNHFLFSFMREKKSSNKSVEQQKV